MRRLRRPAAALGGTLILLALFAGHPAAGVAGEGTKTSAAKHLRFQRTYEAALLEARIRNLPVLVSRHNDF